MHNKIFDITGSVDDIDPVQHDLYHYTILIDVESTVNTKNQIPSQAYWRLQCYTKQKPQYTIGDRIILHNVKIGKKNNNSFSTYLIKEGIHATTFLKNNTATILYRPTSLFRRSIHNFKHRILTQLRKKCSLSTMTLLSSIFLGNRSCIKKQYQHIKDLFSNWGILHYLARSGLHLIIFILLLQFILQYIPIPLIFKQIITLLITGVYALLTWPSISFSRAYASFLWYKLCNILGLQNDMTYTILMLICFFLFINPSLLFFLDFQLSFGLTLVLAITNSQLLHQKVKT
jgi:competence protein ComEC